MPWNTYWEFAALRGSYFLYYRSVDACDNVVLCQPKLGSGMQLLILLPISQCDISIILKEFRKGLKLKDGFIK